MTAPDLPAPDATLAEVKAWRAAVLRRRIVERVDTLGADDLAALAWIVEQLPSDKLRASCEEVTARGWCSSSATRVVVPTTPADHTRAALLSVVRLVSRIVVGRDHPARRERGAVLADEATRRATALTKPEAP